MPGQQAAPQCNSGQGGQSQRAPLQRQFKQPQRCRQPQGSLQDCELQQWVRCQKATQAERRTGQQASVAAARQLPNQQIREDPRQPQVKERFNFQRQKRKIVGEEDLP